MPVGTHAPHAAGVAYAFKLRKKPASPFVCSATARPRRAMSTRRSTSPASGMLPLVFVVTNNQWAISVPLGADRSRDPGAEGIAAGITGEQVDGNDVDRGARGSRSARSQARRNGGPAPDRGADLPARRSYHRGRCGRYRRTRRSRRAGRRSRSRGCAIICWPEARGARRTRSNSRRVPAAHRRARSSAIWRTPRGARDHVRSPLCRAADRLAAQRAGTRGERADA